MLTVTWTPELKLDCDCYDSAGAEMLYFDSIDEYIEDHVSNGVTESVTELISSDVEFEVYGYSRIEPDSDRYRSNIKIMVPFRAWWAAQSEVTRGILGDTV